MFVAASPAAASERQASATGQATARVVAPLKTRLLQLLDFGSADATGASGESIRVRTGGASTASSGTPSPDCSAPAPACSAAHPALIAVTGEAAMGYHVAIPESVVARSPFDANPAIVVTDLEIFSRNHADRSAQGRLDSAGNDYLEVGGTINIPANTGPSHYSAEVPVTVEYD